MTQESLEPQARVRLDSVELTRGRDGTCTVRVALGFPDGALHEGEASTHDTRPGLIRAGADAALQALFQGIEQEIRIEFRGAKAIRAFDSHVVLVAIRVRADGRRTDLIGAVECPVGDLPRGGARALLDAVNRYLARDLSHLRAGRG
jgi:hypothetical protein